MGDRGHAAAGVRRRAGFFVREGARWPPSRTGLLCRSGTAVLDLSIASRRASSGFAAIQSGSRSLFESDQPGLNACSFSAFLFFSFTQVAARATDRWAMPISKWPPSSGERKGQWGLQEGQKFFFCRLLHCPMHTQQVQDCECKEQGRRIGVRSARDGRSFGRLSLYCPASLSPLTHMPHACSTLILHIPPNKTIAQAFS